MKIQLRNLFYNFEINILIRFYYSEVMYIQKSILLTQKNYLSETLTGALANEGNTSENTFTIKNN